MREIKAVSRIRDVLHLPGLIEKCRPAVPRYWHLLIGGIVWFVVGSVLIVVACRWLSQSEWPLNLYIALGSTGCGLLVHFYLFSRIALRNILRIQARPEVTCLFAFQGPRSYFLVLLMMFLGYGLRQLPIPRHIIAAIYLTMGSALAFSSSFYFQAFRSD